VIGSPTGQIHQHSFTTIHHIHCTDNIEYGLFECHLRPVACINAAGVALLRRDTERARKYLQRFATLPEAGCNMGILCLLEGDRGKAEVYLSLAQAGGSVPAGRALRFLQSK